MAHRPGAFVSALNFEIYEALRRREIQLPQTEIRVRGAREALASEPPPARHGSCKVRSPGGLPMNKDELKGKAENLKGRVKEAAGVVANDPELEQEGADERAEGEVREDLGAARRKVGETIEDLGKKLQR